MADAWSGLRSWVRSAAERPSRPPVWVRVPDEDGPPQVLTPRQDYFEVRVSRVHLAAERQWFDLYTPLLFAAAEFGYDGQDAVAPLLVGPGLIKEGGGAAPLSPLYSGTRVAGPVPYAGGGLTLTLALHQLQVGNVVEPLFAALEGAAGALDLAAGLVPYTAIARVVVTGLSAAVGQSEPLLAVRDARPTLETGSWVLLDTAGLEVDQGALQVRGGALCEGDEPVLDLDHVLCTVRRVEAAEVDVGRLPLGPQWRRVLEEASQSSTQESWRNAKANMAALVGALRTSPDLTAPHAEALQAAWVDLLVTAHQQAVRLSSLSDGRAAGPPSALAASRADALAVLDL